MRDSPRLDSSWARWRADAAVAVAWVAYVALRLVGGVLWMLGGLPHIARRIALTMGNIRISGPNPRRGHVNHVEVETLEDPDRYPTRQIETATAITAHLGCNKIILSEHPHD